MVFQECTTARMLRPSPNTAERGITLQTLVITAVLVLLAVAAGVVIVAITDSASDDLEEQSPDLEAKCAPWEIHDPELEAAGVGGGELIEVDENGMVIGSPKPGRGGVTSSKIGCLAPCYVTMPPNGLTLDDLVAQDPIVGVSRLKFDTSNRPPESGIREFRVGVTYRRGTATGLQQDDDSSTGYGYKIVVGGEVKEQLGTHIPPTDEVSSLGIKVTGDKDSCFIADTKSDVPQVNSVEEESDPGVLNQVPDENQAP